MQLRWHDLDQTAQALIMRVWMEAIGVSDPAYVDEGELGRCLRDYPLTPETITAAAGDMAAFVVVCDAFAIPMHRVVRVSEVMPAARLARIARAAGVSIEEAEAIVGADWSNMTDHIRWLATAPDQDISNWLRYCYASSRSLRG